MDSSQINLDSRTSELEIFGEGVISTSNYERDLAIHPDGNQLSYTLSSYNQQDRALVIRYLENEKWSSPEIISFSGKYQDIEPFFSPDGQQLFFASDRPMEADTTRKDYNIWVSQRDNKQWTDPTPLDTLINTKGDEFYPSVAANGNLYFTATRSDGIGREDIFVSRWENRRYTLPTVLDSSINSATYEFNAYIDPNEELLIFSSFGRTDGLGGGDLYYSQKDNGGHWQTAIHLEAPINSTSLDYCPFVDWKNGNFYFTSNRSSQEASRSTYTDFINYNNTPGNGMGDIYRVHMKQLGL